MSTYQRFSRQIYLNIKSYSFLLLPRFILRPSTLIIHKYLRKVFRSQDNEEQIIDCILKCSESRSSIFFFEFGFGPTEFNSAKLSYSGISGRLVDAQKSNVSIAKKLLHKNSKIEHYKLRPSEIRGALPHGFFNIISIDVDGNDYEFAEVAFEERPSLLIVEYNAIFGDLRVKVPYHEDFNRFDYHANYHGASLLSLCDLGHKHNYCLFAVSNSLVNAFFVPSDLIGINCTSKITEISKQFSTGVKGKSTNLSHDFLLEEILQFPLQSLESFKRSCPNS